MKTAPIALVAAVLSLGAGIAANYPENRPPLQPTPYLPLPLGSVRAHGWLLDRLEAQRDGLTGHLPEIMNEVGPNSAWLGGDGEAWEKGPYYVKGLMTLAYTLDDGKLKRDAQKWIDWALGSQREDGSFGPSSNDDWWPRMVMTHILREYANATEDERVQPFLEKYYAHMLRELPNRPLHDWGRSRAGDEIETVLWLYNRNGDKSLLELAKLLHDQAYPWTTILTENRFMDYGVDYQPKHNVNIPQGMKLPAVWWQVSGEQADANAIAAGLEHLERDHGLPLGMNGGTEFLAGRSTTQGIETCSIVERMLTDETAVRILGDPRLGESIERLAFNALPTTMTPAVKQQVYYTLPNNVRTVRGELGFNQDYGNGITPAAPSGFPCCIYNFHMGWPKFVQNSWAVTRDGGLAIVAYAPTTVTAKVADGVEATIEEKTDYPFADTIALSVSIAKPAQFPLVLRIPDWCATPQIAVNGEAIAGLKPGSFHRIDREWRNGDKVAIRFPMTVHVTRGMNDSISVHRGPLLYSLRIAQDWKVVEQRTRGFDTLEVETKQPWNYGLVLGNDVNASFAFEPKRMPKNPFNPDTPPGILKAKAQLVPGWTLAWNERVAFDPPPSPVAGEGSVRTIELVPAGTQTLRVTCFPWIGKPKPAPKEVKPNFATEGLTNWIPYGGGWFVQDGALVAARNGGTGGSELKNGGKVVATQTDFSDLEYEADVSSSTDGQAGLIFRVTRPSIGANAYSGYYVGIRPGDRKVLFGKADGEWTELAVEDSAIEADKPHRLRVVAKGPKIEVFLDGGSKPVISLEDSSFTHGAVGVRNYFTDPPKVSATFANIHAKAL
jgi:Uncharacterized protein conserved in bacteria